MLALRSREPSLATAVDRALVGIRSPQAGAVLAERLSLDPSTALLRQVAETGPSARDAGPAVVALLRHPDWELRVAAARALGYIGHEAATGALIPLLESDTDVRLAWAAAESLGRLRAASAQLALRHTRDTHWLPAVREAARRALEAIHGGARDQRQTPGSRFSFEFMEYASLTEEMQACRTPALRAVKEPRSQKLYGAPDASRLAKRTYEATIVSYGADEATMAAAKPGEIIEVTPQNMVEHRKAVPQTPGVALKVADGWLVGADRGEWGGELVFIGDDGARQTILDENVENLFQLGSRYVAVTGLAHLTLNEGMLYELAPDARGRWRAQQWRALPGAPQASWRVKTGELLVNLYGDVPILVGPSGSMRMAPCASPERKR